MEPSAEPCYQHHVETKGFLVGLLALIVAASPLLI